MFKKLKIGAQFSPSTPALLKKYLDKGYKFRISNNEYIEKDTTYEYPYRFIMPSVEINDEMHGAWDFGYAMTVTTVPNKTINFKDIYRV